MTLFVRLLATALTMLFFSGVSFHIWRAQASYDRNLVRQYAETIAGQIGVRVETLMTSGLTTLQLMAERWVERKPLDFSEERFLTYAATISRLYPVFSEIHWVGPEGSVVWGYTDGSPGIWKKRNFYEHLPHEYLQAFERAKESLQLSVSASSQATDGTTAFSIVVPLCHDHTVQGFFVGVFRVDNLMKLSLSADVLRDYRVGIMEAGKLLYSSVGSISAEGTLDSLTVSTDVSFSQKAWRLELNPIRTQQSATGAHDFYVLYFGLFFSGALSCLLFLLLRKIALYKCSRDRAVREVEHRMLAEQALLENEKKRDQLVKDLKARNTELESFVYMASHDLKTPIVTIQGFARALREDFAAVLQGEARRYLDLMCDAVMKMESLIDHLLYLSRIGKMSEVETVFPLREAVLDAISILKPRLDENHFQVCIQEDLPLVKGERQLWTQVFDNLVHNAVKYMDPGNLTPKIEIGCLVRDDEDVVFVRDKGIGIEDKYHETIFNLFCRLPGARRLSDGSGIGLTIVKRVVEHHGGRIWVESRIGEGATFYFTLRAKGP